MAFLDFDLHGKVFTTFAAAPFLSTAGVMSKRVFCQRICNDVTAAVLFLQH
jgi:hypothetical protein